MSRLIRIACWVLGIAAFAGVILKTGVHNLEAYAGALMGWGSLVLLFWAFVNFWDVWGWRVVFQGVTGKRVPFWTLFWIRVTGEAVNGVTPFVDIGGEFIKVQLAAQRFGLDKREVLPTVVIQRTALFASEVAFWFLGLGIAVAVMPAVRQSQGALLWSLAVCIPVVFLLYRLQRSGFFASFYGLFKRFLKKEDALVQGLELKIQDVDTRIAAFYKTQTARNAYTFILHLAGWIAGGVETWLMFRLVGVPVTLLDGIILEALLQMLKTVSFFIPGNLGAQEAGLAYFGGWFGYAGPAGVAVSLLKRLRQLVWTAIGFAIWGPLAKPRRVIS